MIVSPDTIATILLSAFSGAGGLYVWIKTAGRKEASMEATIRELAKAVNSLTKVVDKLEHGLAHMAETQQQQEVRIAVVETKLEKGAA